MRTTLAEVAEAFLLDADNLRSKSRRAPLVRARAAAAYIMRERDGLSYPQIGARLARDHTTAMYACRRAQDFIKRDVSFETVIDDLLERKANPMPPRAGCRKPPTAALGTFPYEDHRNMAQVISDERRMDRARYERERRSLRA